MTRLEPAPADRLDGRRPRPSLTGIVGRSLKLLRTNPRDTMLPMLAIQLPLGLIVGAITVALYVTVFRDQPVDPLDRLFSGGHRGQQFMTLALEAASALFTWVAFGATVASVAARIRDRPLPLPQALDPAFTHMGGLLAIGLIALAVASLTGIPVIGFFLGPYLLIRLALTLPVFMIEGVRPGLAMRRSWTLMSRDRLTLLGLGLVAFGFIAVPSIGLALGAQALGSGRTAVIGTKALLAVANGVVLVPMLSFAIVALTLFYFDVATKEATGHARS